MTNYLWRTTTARSISWASAARSLFVFLVLMLRAGLNLAGWMHTLRQRMALNKACLAPHSLFDLVHLAASTSHT